MRSALLNARTSLVVFATSAVCMTTDAQSRESAAASAGSATGQNASQPQGRNAAPGPTNHDDPKNHPYLGMWVTADGHIRHELLPNGRYDEQRGSRKSAYQGRYWVKGNRIAYWDDTGFSADGEFRDGRFYHGGYVFTRISGPRQEWN